MFRWILRALNNSEDFGSILRSFARSGELDKNPKSLPAFLFGQHDQERIVSLFETINSQIERDQHNYRQNVERIRKLTAKSNTFRRVGDLRQRVRAVRRVYQAQQLANATQSLRHWEQQAEDRQLQTRTAEWILHRLILERERQGLRELQDTASQYRFNLRELVALPKQLAQTEERTVRARTGWERAAEQLRQANQRTERAEAVARWLPFGQRTYDGLVSLWRRTQARTRRLAARQHLLQHLESRGQAKHFPRVRMGSRHYQSPD